MQDSKKMLHASLLIFSYLVACCVLVLVWIVSAAAQSQIPAKKMAKAFSDKVEQQLYREYRGVTLGMTMQETRAKLGEPASKADDQDFYVLSPNETAQVVYDSAQKVKTISTDYTNGMGAPDYRTVVGPDLQQRPDGSAHKIVFHEKEGFWVSYNKSAGAVVVVTVTLQVIRK